MSRHRRKKVPTDPVNATIETLTHDGRGLAHINGKATFIDDALTGEEVAFVYTEQRGNYDCGKTVTVFKSAPERVPAKCEFFSICGGCSMQHLAHVNQLELKQNTLLEQLQHFGNIAPEQILVPLTGPQWGYRRKARLSVKYVSNKNSALVGFREKRNSFVADINYCEVLHPLAAQLIKPLKILITELDARCDIPQIEVAVDDHQVALVIRHLLPLSANDQEQLSTFAKLHKLYLFLQPGGHDSIHLFYPENTSPYLSYYFSEYDLRFEFMPTDFSQVNLDINKQMIQQAITLLEPNPQEKLLDLFCGFGNFTLPFAKFCQQVVGVEGSETAVQRAQYNAEINRSDNVSFHCYDLIKDFSQTPWAKQSYDLLLLDPPRTGAKEVVEKIDVLNPKKILYISCNPATLARDAGILVHTHGYRLKKAGIMDMFPHTTHVESIALFVK